ncbi:MAG: universal stress protein [Syntrophobacteraceae bacterium]|jgi:nucleotide-binding universal stress UspA family protein|nr:universal stress protein [Syntrophobacteraceae bacterium]
MGRKLLITVGDDPDSLYGVRFVATFFNNRRDMTLTLLHVAPHFESMDLGESLRVREMDSALSEIYMKKGRKALDAGRTILLNEDFQAHQISTKLMPKRYGMIGDMIEEAIQGSYDAIVLGRRGYSIFEKVFHPWVSEATMDLEIDFPLWVCRRPERGLKDVLVCVDGSEPALRMLEVVGLMVGNEEQHGIGLLHVDDGTVENVETVMEPARRKLLEIGVAEERIRVRVVRDSDVAAAVRGEAAENRYAVVAVGRRGIGRESSLRKPFMGSKSLELLQTLEKATLWVSR